MDEYRKELQKVKQELCEVEIEIDQILQRQQKLQQRKQELQTILTQSSSASKDDDKKWDGTEFPWSKNLQNKLVSVFGISNLRPMQLQTMNISLSGKDCILIMPTGGGKSLCFQLPALVSKGITLVVSPLVSLMEDQIMALENLAVEAAMLNASSSKGHVKNVQDAMVDKKSTLKLIYVTPEKLAKSKRFMARLEKMYQAGLFARLVIDEVHCCSQWGHDFRPDYKFLGIMKRQFPGVPILGLTATATFKVLEDVKKILSIPHCHLFRASFNRPNLYYEVREKPSSQKEVMDEIQRLINRKFKDQSGIIYCFSRKESEDITLDLLQRGIKAGCYHGDISAQNRADVHRKWLRDDIKVVVATVAFGMGIDKPDVRFVIHHSLSKSMENLYQESGRAGRDDQVSHCILYYRLADVFRQSTMVFTEQTGLDNLYGIMEYCADISKCRRSVIAHHFGESWDQTQCNKMCDHCDVDKEVAAPYGRDITRLCQDVLKLVDQAAVTDQRITAIKLVDAWTGKGAMSLRLKEVSAPSVTRQKLERILAKMLMSGYIKEDFHFTPYSTISYLVAGPKARLLRSGAVKVEMDFPAKAKPTLQTQNSKPAPTTSTAKSSSSEIKATSLSSQKSTSKDNPKPKLVVINPEKSQFSSVSGSQRMSGDNVAGVMCKMPSSGDRTTNSKGKGGNSVSGVKKRKPIVQESDNDDLDFGDITSGPRPPKIKGSNSLKRKTAIVESDSDNSDFDLNSGPSKSKQKMQSKDDLSPSNPNGFPNGNNLICIESDSSNDDLDT